MQPTQGQVQCTPMSVSDTEWNENKTQEPSQVFPRPWHSSQGVSNHFSGMEHSAKTWCITHVAALIFPNRHHSRERTTRTEPSLARSEESTKLTIYPRTQPFPILRRFGLLVIACSARGGKPRLGCQHCKRGEARTEKFNRGEIHLDQGRTKSTAESS